MTSQNLATPTPMQNMSGHVKKKLKKYQTSGHKNVDTPEHAFFFFLHEMYSSHPKESKNAIKK